MASPFPSRMKLTDRANPKTDIPIPEPRHRVGPKGVSSGISFRNLPPPSLDEIKKICEHYQEKCSGTYKSLASRYVYQMATEIEGLVDVMQGDCTSGSELSSPYRRSRSDKENVEERFSKKNSKSRQVSRRSSRSSGSAKQSSLPCSRSDRNAPLRNASSKQNMRQAKCDVNDKERLRWRKEFRSVHPEVVVASQKDTRRRINRRHQDSMCSSTSSFSDDDESSDNHYKLPTKPDRVRDPSHFGKDDILKWLMEEGSKPNGLDGYHHDEILKWLKDEMDRSQYLLKRSKHMHSKELGNAKKELEKVKKAAKIIIKAVRAKGEEKAAKLEANVHSERRQRIKSQKMVKRLINSQSEQLDQLKRVDRSDELSCPWDNASRDICDLMGDSDLTSVLDELAEAALQQSYCS